MYFLSGKYHDLVAELKNIVKSHQIFTQMLLYLITVLLAGVLSNCSSVEKTLDLPTLIPTEYLPTAISLTSQALISQRVTATPAVQTAEPQATFTPTITASPAITGTLTPTPTSAQAQLDEEFTATPHFPFEIPYAKIQFIKPGALSRVISPIDLHVFLLPGDSGRARVELFGEDGRLMYRKLFVFGNPVDIQTNLRVEIDFEIKGVAETANLVVSVDDAYGRIKTQASQELILLSLGDADITPPGDLLEPIVIQEPAPEVLVQGGGLVVSGLVRTASDQPLLVELIATDGRIIGNRLAGIAPEPKSKHRLFAAEVPFKVYSPTWVRVTVSERSPRWGGPVQLTSVEVLLAP
jgi:hypothetical protein